MLTTTELKIRVDEHDRRTYDADRHGWMQADARGERKANPRAVLGTLVGLVVRRQAARPAGAVLTGGTVPAPETSPRAAA